ncbi:caspase family protein, partial [Corallococcus exercitus]|nr:caspase family protein [Corallococcus exercitus]
GWEGVLLDGRLDLWVDVAAGQGNQSLRLDPGGVVPVRHRTLLLGVALGPTWTWGRLGFSTGPRVAALWLQRSFQLELLDRDERYVTAWPGWMAAVSFRFTPVWVVEARTQLLWAYVPVDGQTRTVGFGGLMLAGGYRF